MSLRFALTAAACLALTPPASAQDLAPAEPESVGMSSDRLAEATAALQAHVNGSNIAGVVAAVARHGRVVYFEALGQRDRETGDAMARDDLFRLYSMTRPITSTAVMMLWEEGRFRLDDPIDQYLPQFAAQRVFEDPAAPRPRPHPPPFRRHHGAAPADPHVRHRQPQHARLPRRGGPAAVHHPARDGGQRRPRAPVRGPGTRFRYGISTTILGRLVEVWSGQPFEEFLAERLFGPLGMTDTVFWADGDRADRLTTVYRLDDGSGELYPWAIEDVPFTERPALIEGGVGLLSTVMDYLRFSQMFLNGGALDGVRVLEAETVALMTRNHVPDAALPLSRSGYMSGSGWGLGFNVVLDADRYRFPVGDGEYWWDGSSGTRFSIDPEHGLITVIMAAVSPSRGGGFREEFKDRVHRAMVDEHEPSAP